ncbi:hypothetical protein SUGI_0245410, partial [Cryptomeria japonica]
MYILLFLILTTQEREGLFIGPAPKDDFDRSRPSSHALELTAACRRFFRECEGVIPHTERALSCGSLNWLNCWALDNLEKDDMGAEETESDVCIFGIAYPLLRLKPESYIPESSPFKFTMLVKRIGSLEGRIKACYHKHIPYDIETLSWMLALDTSFLVQFLKSTYRPYGESYSRLMRKHTVLHSKRKTPLWYAIKNDILMLENQVPLFLLLEVLCETANCIQSDTGVGSRSEREVNQHNGRFEQLRSQSQKEISQDVRFQEKLHLASILQAACFHFNPFVCHTKFPRELDVGTKSHVLDYLYDYVTAASPEPVRRNSEPQNKASRIVFSAFDKYLFSNLFNKLLIRQRMIYATTAGNLPSVSELSEAGIKFAPYDSGDLKEIRFDRTTSTLLLPKIKIDDSTERKPYKTQTSITAANGEFFWLSFRERTVRNRDSKKPLHLLSVEMLALVLSEIKLDCLALEQSAADHLYIQAQALYQTLYVAGFIDNYRQELARYPALTT